MQETYRLDKLRIFSGSGLKLIAVITMLIDHCTLVLAPALPFMTAPLFSSITLYYILRKIGRLAFPIYCFLISEGFAHTRNKKVYTLRLLLFALLSELPYDLMVSSSLLYLAKQNVFFTLFFGSLMLYIYEYMADSFKKAALMVAVLAAAILLRVDYSAAGVVLILLLYIFKEHRALQTVTAYPLLSGGLAAYAAFIPINMYNGRRGFINSGVLKYFFYLFYPLHMLLLALIRHFLKSA